MRKTFLIAMMILATAFTVNAQDKKDDSKVKHLTYNDFLHKVWDFEDDPTTFRYRGKLPAVVDFYADWCGPCRRVAPIMEKLAEEYDGKLMIYKINIDQERDLAKAFNVRSIPTVLFIPTKGKPMMQVGAATEEWYRNIIVEQLLKDEASSVEQMTYNDFINKVWDLEKDPDTINYPDTINHPDTINYKGNQPAIIEFYIPECPPCITVMSIMEKLSQEFNGKLLFYKVDAIQEQELSTAFNVVDFPMVLFIPMKGQPIMETGAKAEEEEERIIRSIIEEQLLK